MKPLSGPQFPQLFQKRNVLNLSPKATSKQEEQDSWETTEKERSAHKEWIETRVKETKMPRALKSSKHRNNFLLDTQPTLDTD